MAGEWQRLSLREAGVTLIDCDHRTPPPAEDGYPYVAIPQLRNGRIDLSGARRITREHLIEWTKKAKPAANDVVLSRRCNPGETAFVQRGFEFALGQNLVLLRADGERVDPPFLRWLVRGPEWWEQIGKFLNVGAVFDSLRCADVPNFELHIPPLDEQRAIAHILGTLDDKIELNRRMNETLEAMARALFKSWFVDFLPVRAKMAAKANDPSLLLPQAEPGTWYVYAIECNDGSLYIGQTEDLRQRWLQHVGGKGASWTKQHPPVRVPYWEKQPSREAAVERENWLKTGYGRKWLKQEIAARTQTGDPVRAKAASRPSMACGPRLAPIGEAEGRDPLPAPQSEAARQAGGLPKPLADLFPDSFEDSELGEIPKGWRVGVLGDVAEHPRRTVQPQEIEPTTPYIALEYMPRRCIALSEWGVADGLESNKFEFKRGEILFGKLRPYFHKVGVAAMDGVCSTDIVVVSPCAQEWFGFVLGHISSDAFVEHTNAGSTGTKMPRTSWGDMARYAVVTPPENVAKAFTCQIRPAVDHTIASIHESRTLAALRDTLLPNLISGEMRAPHLAYIAGSHKP